SKIEVWQVNAGNFTSTRLNSFFAFYDLASRNASVLTLPVDNTGDGIIDKIATVQGQNGTSATGRLWNVDGSGTAETFGLPQTAAWNMTNLNVLAAVYGGAGSGGAGESWYGELSTEATAVNQDAARREVAPAPGMNSADQFDVDGDGFVAPNDALRILNLLNSPGGTQSIVDGQIRLADGTPVPLGRVADGRHGFVDVDGDGYVAPSDVLLVINELNRIVMHEALAAVALAEAMHTSPADEAIEAASTPRFPLDASSSDKALANDLTTLKEASTSSGAPTSTTLPMVVASTSQSAAIDSTSAGIRRFAAAADQLFANFDF
ncbi:MAG TPA: hypothetical protein PLV92_25595, partial [Pirellulaceae bacterium]|nr:hypothetical protein [Pirellulaceae bacterium]